VRASSETDRWSGRRVAGQHLAQMIGEHALLRRVHLRVGPHGEDAEHTMVTLVQQAALHEPVEQILPVAGVG
jgi:hypothetical protein